MWKYIVGFSLIIFLSCASSDQNECGFEVSDLINGSSENQALTHWRCSHSLKITLLSLFEDGTGRFENNGETVFFTWQESHCGLIDYSTELVSGSFSDILVSRSEGLLDFTNEVGGKAENYQCTLQPAI